MARVATRRLESLDALDEELRPKDDGSPDVAEEVHERVRMERLRSMPHERLLRTMKGTFYRPTRWKNELDPKHKLNPDNEWRKLMADPRFDLSSDETLARWCVVLENEIGEVLRRDPKAYRDPKKIKYLRDLKV